MTLLEPDGMDSRNVIHQMPPLCYARGAPRDKQRHRPPATAHARRSLAASSRPFVH